MRSIILGAILFVLSPAVSYSQMGGGGMMGGGMMGGGGWRNPQSPDQGRGANIFQVDCSGCHAQGGNLIYPNLPLRGASQLADFDSFLAYLRNPTMPDGSQGPMPAFPPERISDEQAKDLYWYINNTMGGGPSSGAGPGYGMGPGMMNRGYGTGMGFGGWQSFRRGPQHGEAPVSLDQAKQEVQDYLQSTRNPNIKLGNVEDKESYFEAEVVTNNGSLVDKIAVDKDTGRMHPAH